MESLPTHWLALVAVALAAATWAMVEEPFRRGRLVPHGRGRGFAMAGAAVLILVLGSTVVGVVGDRDVAAAAAGDADAASADDAASPTGPDDPSVPSAGVDALSTGPDDESLAPPAPRRYRAVFAVRCLSSEEHDKKNNCRNSKIGQRTPYIA